MELDALCDLIVDCEHKTAPTQATGYPSIRTPNIGRGRLLLEGVNRVSEETYTEWTRRTTPKEEDLILAREAPVGNVAIIPRGLKVCLGQRTVLIRPDRSKVDPQYLLYLLLGDEVQGVFQSQATGATVGHLNVKDIRALSLPPIPPMHVQRRIGSILSAYDDLIENNTRRIAILEEMARALYREWFVNLRFPGHEDVRLVESALGRIPDGWAVSALSTLADVNARSITRGREPQELRYIDIASVATGCVEHVQSLRFAEAPGRARRIVRDGDVIWSCVRPNRKSYALILEPEPNLVASTGFAVLSPKAVPSAYLYHFVTTDSFVGYLANHATGAAYPAVTAKDFEAAQVVRPPAALLGSFESAVEPMVRQSHCLRGKNAVLRQTRDLLLPKLISGELDVSRLAEAPVEVVV
jgi:type I restriction enzyme S subunit